MIFNRITFTFALVLAASTAVSAGETKPETDALTYLESLKGVTKPYIAPSEIDPRYTIAIYVNAATRGATRQRMWVLQRDRVGAPWRMAMWDEEYWKKKKLAPDTVPPFSWLVSTGRKYRGDRFSGPTPLGVYSIDERRGRSTRGYYSAGMYHTLFIDYHYSSGRRSGVAFHGTTRSLYRRLGRVDSHGCIRMRQPNALALLNRVRGWDKVLPEEDRWGQVPRFWTRERNGKRYGYRRDGRSHLTSPTATNEGTPVMTDQSPLSTVLTKVGYRAISVIFKD